MFFCRSFFHLTKRDICTYASQPFIFSGFSIIKCIDIIKLMTVRLSICDFDNGTQKVCGEYRMDEKKRHAPKARLPAYFICFSFFNSLIRDTQTRIIIKAKGKAATIEIVCKGFSPPLISVRGTVLLTLSKGAIFKMCKYRQKTGRHRNFVLSKPLCFLLEKYNYS